MVISDNIYIVWARWLILAAFIARKWVSSFHCIKWQDQKNMLLEQIDKFTPDNIVDAMLESGTKWSAVKRYVEYVLRRKKVDLDTIWRNDAWKDEPITWSWPSLRGRGISLVEAPLDAVDDGHCKCEGILNTSSHTTTKKSMWTGVEVRKNMQMYMLDYLLSYSDAISYFVLYWRSKQKLLLKLYRFEHLVN